MIPSELPSAGEEQSPSSSKIFSVSELNERFTAEQISRILNPFRYAGKGVYREPMSNRRVVSDEEVEIRNEMHIDADTPISEFELK